MEQMSKEIFTRVDFTKQRRSELWDNTTPEEQASLLSPLKSIRQKCMDCCCGQSGEVAKCTAYDCALWDFRFGTNPHRQGKTLTDEERKKIGERMQAGKAGLDSDSEEDTESEEDFEDDEEDE